MIQPGPNRINLHHMLSIPQCACKQWPSFKRGNFVWISGCQRAENCSLFCKVCNRLKQTKGLWDILISLPVCTSWLNLVFAFSFQADEPIADSTNSVLWNNIKQTRKPRRCASSKQDWKMPFLLKGLFTNFEENLQNWIAKTYSKFGDLRQNKFAIWNKQVSQMSQVSMITGS